MRTQLPCRPLMQFSTALLLDIRDRHQNELDRDPGNPWAQPAIDSINNELHERGHL